MGEFKDQDEPLVPNEPDDGPIRADEMSWGDRTLITKGTLSPRHRKLCELAARGWTQKRIAEELNYTANRVSILISNRRIRDEIEIMREKIYEGTIGQRMKDLARPAVDELERCLTDETNKYKENLKVETAKWVVEKIDGKAVQKHDIGENMLSVMLDRLDAMKASGQKSAPDIDAQARPVKELVQISPQTEEDMLKDWVIDFKSGIKK